MADTNGTNGSSNYGDAFNVLEDLTKKAEALRAGDEKMRDALIADCFKMVAALETPGEMFTRIMWTHTVNPSVLLLANNMDIFDKLKNKGSSMTTTEIAKPESLDPKLVRKVLKVLATFYAVKQVDADTWAANDFSNSMAEDEFKGALTLFMPWAADTYLKTPEFFKELNYQWPSSAVDAPVQYAKDVRNGKHLFELMKRDDQAKNLESLMKVWQDKRPHWSDESSGYYPIRERLIKGADSSPDSVFLVDVGGGHGQDFPRLLTNVPQKDIPGRFVLQDLPHVIEQIAPNSLPASVERVNHDFFMPQPIQGARVYFMHNILHNHTDERCISILKALTPAMKKGYSKLILWDNVMPDKDAGSIICGLDWTMMTFFGASERTEKEWRELLESPEVGLKVTDIVHYSSYDQDVIEVELA